VACGGRVAGFVEKDRFTLRGAGMDPIEKQFEELERLRRQMHRFVEHVSRLATLPAQFTSGVWSPPADVYEDEEAYLVVFELPGVDPHEVKVVVEGNLLTVSGRKELKATERGERARAHQLEIATGPFQRLVQLPGLTRSGAVRAKYSNGLLYVRLPKLSPEERRKDVPVEE